MRFDTTAISTERKVGNARLPAAGFFFTGFERANMRFEQFEIELIDGQVVISQDGQFGEDAYSVAFPPEQIEILIVQLRAAVLRAGGEIDSRIKNGEE